MARWSEEIGKGIGAGGIASREFGRTVAAYDVFGGSKVGLRAIVWNSLREADAPSIEDESPGMIVDRP
jgi:hypothetical protein